MTLSEGDESLLTSIRMDAELEERAKRAHEHDVIKIVAWLTACAACLIAVYMILVIAP